MILSKFGWKMGKIKNFSIPPSIKTCMKFMLCIDFNIWSASQHLTTHLECLGTRYAILILVLFSMILALFSNFSFFSFFLKFSRRKKIFFSFSRKKKLRKIWNVYRRNWRNWQGLRQNFEFSRYILVITCLFFAPQKIAPIPLHVFQALL